jgi:hypothetical protein
MDPVERDIHLPSSLISTGVPERRDPPTKWGKT